MNIYGFIRLVSFLAALLVTWLTFDSELPLLLHGILFLAVWFILNKLLIFEYRSQWRELLQKDSATKKPHQI